MELTDVSIMHIRAANRRDWPCYRDASRCPADMQACLGIQGGPIFRDAATNAGAKMDRSLVGRSVSLRDNFRTLRDRIFPIKGKRHRDRVRGAIHVEAGFSGSVGRFLG